MENNNSLTNMASVCGLAEEDIQRLHDAFAQLAEALSQVVDVIIDAFSKVASWIGKIISLVDWQDQVCRANLSNRHYYLCKHAKKARTRKKYQNLAFRRFSHAN